MNTRRCCCYQNSAGGVTWPWTCQRFLPLDHGVLSPFSTTCQSGVQLTPFPVDAPIRQPRCHMLGIHYCAGCGGGAQDGLLFWLLKQQMFASWLLSQTTQGAATVRRVASAARVSCLPAGEDSAAALRTVEQAAPYVFAGAVGCVVCSAAQPWAQSTAQQQRQCCVAGVMQVRGVQRVLCLQ